MRNYLSFGGGVNSVAMYLYLVDQGIKFTAIFVDHGTDWPETYGYVAEFITRFPVTILYPDVEPTEMTEGFDNLYDYCKYKKIIPSFHRWCTDKFKLRTIYRYIEKPCFMNIGFDAGEEHRAKINHKNGVENRYPLIEAGMNRIDCINLIKSFGLEVPRKSGCYICPFQRVAEWKELRRKHPDLYCKANALETICNKNRKKDGKKPIYINGKCSVKAFVDENQIRMFDVLPPCECML